MAGFKLIETVLQNMLAAKDDADPHLIKRVSGVQLATAAHRSNLITAEAFGAIQGLAVLRNLAAHGMEKVDTAKALDYLNLLDGALYSLKMSPGWRPPA